MEKKKYLRYILRISLILLLIFALQGCGNDREKEPSEEADNKVNETRDDASDLSKPTEEIYNLSITQGKLAVYYFSSPVPSVSTWIGSYNAGDAMLIVCPDGTTAMIDCNTPLNASYIVAKLQEMGIEKIDHFFNTHPHVDHIGGLPTLLTYIDVENFYAPPEVVMERGEYFWYEAKEMLEEKNVPIRYLSTGDVVNLTEDVKITIFNPDAHLADDTDFDLNEYSLVMRMEYGESSYLFTGDIGNNEGIYGRATETELAAVFGSQLSADVYKTGHHGSTTTNRSEEWLQLINAKVIVTTASVVEDVLQHWMCIENSEVNLNTSLDGDIAVVTEGDATYSVLVQKERENTDYYDEVKTVDGWIEVE